MLAATVVRCVVGISYSQAVNAKQQQWCRPQPGAEALPACIGGRAKKPLAVPSPASPADGALLLCCCVGAGHLKVLRLRQGIDVSLRQAAAHSAHRLPQRCQLQGGLVGGRRE